MTDTKNTLVVKLKQLNEQATPEPWPCYADPDIAEQITIDGVLRPAICSTDAELIAEMRNALPLFLELYEAAAAFTKADTLGDKFMDAQVNLMKVVAKLEEAEEE